MKVILLFIIILVIFVFLPGSNSWNGCPAGKYKGRLVTDGPNGIEPVNDPWTKRQIGYRYDVVGTTYSARCDNKPNSKPCGVNSRRRQLLQDEYGNSGERL